MRSISVVIPNFNGRHLLERNLPAVFRALRESGVTDSEVIVADDASSDDSLAFLATSYPQILVVANRDNRGFASNINTGIFRAQKELVLLLNSDVELLPDYFVHQFAHFNNPSTFGVGGRIESMDRSVIQDAAKFPSLTFANIGSTRNCLPLRDEVEMWSWFLSGANALVDRNKLLALGGFREIFSPFYCEDVDLGLRAWRMGFQLHYEHRAICLHPNSETIRRLPSARVRRIAKRNQMFLHFLHLDGVEWACFLLWTGFKALLRLLIFQTLHASAYLEMVRRWNELSLLKREFRTRQAASGMRMGLREVADRLEQKLAQVGCKGI